MRHNKYIYVLVVFGLIQALSVNAFGEETLTEEETEILENFEILEILDILEEDLDNIENLEEEDPGDKDERSE
jgi:hypothetical protein